MGTDIAREIITHNHINSSQRLWRHVLLNALEDAQLLQSDRKSSIYKMEAHEWIAEDTKDFQTICWWSGWDPEQVKEKYLKAVKNGNVTFTDRQIKWIKYYKQYLELKKEPIKEKRKPLRMALTQARTAVFNATTALVSNLVCLQRG